MTTPARKDVFKLNEKRVLEAIKQGCLKRVPCTMAFDGDPSDHASMLLYTDRQSADSDRVLLIAAPHSTAEPPEGTSIEVRFEYDGRSLIFYTEHESSDTFQTQDVSLDAWRVKYPEELYQIQRRSFFRVRAGTDQPVSIGVSVTGSAEDVTDEEGSQISQRNAIVVDRDDPEDGEVSGVMWDISGGGLSFTLQPEPLFQISPGAEVEMEIQLPGIKEDLFFKGQIVGRKQTLEGETIYSVEYTDTEGSARLRRSHNIALQYIAQVERSLLKDLRMAKRWR